MLNSEGQLLKETEQKQVICLKSISHVSKRNNVQINEPCIICWWMYINWNIHNSPYVHAGVDLCNRLVIGGKLVDLHSVANQLACDFYFELGQFTLGDGIWLGDDRDNIHLGGGEMLSLGKMQLRLYHASKYRAASILCVSNFFSHAAWSSFKHSTSP